jgi:hypothetical protein
MNPIRPAPDGTWPWLGESFFGEVALGNMTQFKIGIHRTDHGYLVSVCEHGAYEFSGFAHWSYVNEKLGVLDGDARNIADLINAQLVLAEGKKQGIYEPQFCTPLVAQEFE